MVKNKKPDIIRVTFTLLNKNLSILLLSLNSKYSLKVSH